MSDRICPICSSENNKKIYSLSIDSVIKEIIPDEKSNHIEELRNVTQVLWHDDKVSFYKCEECNYGFADPYVAGNTEYYSLLYYADFQYPEVKWEYNETLKVLKNNINEKTRILEIGAGNGSFLDLIAQSGILKKNIYATEYSDTACDILRSKGYHSINQSFESLIKSNKLPKFDIICMFQVLEHLDSIHKLFQFLNYFSKGGTHLFIAVPNTRLRYLLDQFNIHYDIPPTHVGKLSLDTFQYLSRKYGWQIINYGYEPTSFLERIKKFVFERYAKNRIAIKFEKSNYKLTKYFMRYFILIQIFIRYHKLFYKLHGNNYGTSFWIHLQNIDNN